VARNSTQSQAGRQGSSGDAASGEQPTSGAEPAQRRGGTASDSEQGQQTEARSDDGRGSGVLSATRENSVSQREEVDENGRPFIKAEDGTTIFGEIRNDSGLTPAPIKLSEGYQDEEGKGYGLARIEAKHGDEIRNAGFASVEEFVSYVAKNYDEDNIRVGKRRDNGSPTFLIQITDTHDNTLFIELSKDGTYWNVNSAGVFRKGYSNKKETVAKTEPQQPNNAVSTGSSLSESGEGGITPSEPNGKPTVSDGKVTESSKTEQENGGKTVIDKYQEYLDGIEVEKGKLPKGVKWTDGVEKKTKGGKHSNAETVGAVFVGNDLYVRKKYATDQTIVVKNATSLNANDVVAKFDSDAGGVVSPLLSDAIFEVYQKAGLPINNNGVHLRPLMPTTKEAGTKETREPTEKEGIPEKPQIKEGESPIEYAARMAEWQNVKDCIDAGVAYSAEFDDLKRRIKEIVREDDGYEVRAARLTELYADYRAKHGESGRMAEYREAANKVFEDYYQKAKADIEAQDVEKQMREAPDKILRDNIEMWENAEENADGVVDKDIARFITGEFREPSINSGLTNTLIGDEAILKAKRDALLERAKAELARREKHPQKQKEAAEQDYKEKTLWMKMRPDGSAIYAYIAARSGGMLDVRFFWGYSESDGEAKKMTIDELRNTFGGKQVEVGSAALPATQVPKIENYIKRYGKKRLRESLKQTATNGTKPVATEGQASDPAEQLRTVGYTIEHRKDTRDNSDLYAVKFDARVSREEFSGQRAIAKRLGGYWSNFGKKGFLFKTEEAAQDFAETVMGRTTEEVKDEAPLSLADMQQKNEGASEDASKPASEQQQTETQKPVNPSGNKLVTDERYAELRERMRKKMLGQMNMGIDPEILTIGTEMAVYHIEKGARRFVDYAKAMIADLGDAIRPYLKAFYNGARDLPEMEASGLSKEMTPYDEVASVDIANFDKQGAKDLMATAENIVKEHEVSQQAEEAEEKLRAERGAARKAAQKKVEPIGKGGLGDIYDQFEGDAKGAIEFLTEKKSGVAKAALFHHDVGYIDLAWGNERYGLEHILLKYPEEANDLQELLDEMNVIERSDNRIVLESDTHRAVVSKMKGDTPTPEWLLTAYKKKEKSVSASSSDIETKPVGKRNGTATPQSGLSEGKGNKKVGGNRAKAGKPVSSPTEPSLFDNVEPQNDKDNGLQRVHELRSERLSADKTNTEQPVGEHGADVIQEGVGRADGRRDEEVQGVPEGSSSTRRPVGRLQGLEQPKNTHNNHAERGTDYAPRGENARIEANIKAIETMQRLIESGERATPEDMAVLRRFSGWGGLDSAFNEGGAFRQASPYNAKLRQLLTPEQYESANMSRNSAYYTPAEVIDAMWDVARAMGFKGGKVLEGSAGIGNILGLMPTEMSERSDIHAVEKDDVTGQILSLLYPDAKVDVQGFEKTQIPNGSVDLAITNVPFVTRLHAFDETGDKDLSRKFANIHDFCIAKNVRKLRQGGIGIFISSSGTLDSTKLRGWLTSDGGADVVGAFRLNNKTFGGTRATSDIIVVRKRVNGKKSVGAIDVSGTGVLRVVKYDNGEGKKDSVKDLALSFNKYFVEHPENMAGEMAFAFEKGETFRATSKALYPTEGKDQSQMLKDWAKQFANMDWEAAEAKTENAQPIYEDLGEGIKEGSMLLDKNGTLCIAREGAAVPLLVNSSKVKGHTKAECFNDYKAIQDALEEVLQYQTEHEDDKGLQPLLKKLNKAYDDFVSTYGHLNKNTAISFLRSDIDFASIAALEKVKYHDDEHHKRIADYKKAEVFSHRVVEKETVPTPKNVRDGVISSVYLNGKIDIPYIAAQLQRNADEVRKEVLSEKLGFENPITGEIEVSYEYLSGNVREKLEQARAANTDGRYDSNIRELETKVPFDIPAHLIEFTLGSTFLEPRHYADYIKDRTDADVSLTNTGGMWVMKLNNEFSAERSEKNRALGVWSDKCSKWIYGHQLIEAAIQNKTISVTKSIKHYDGKTETIKDKDATLACTQKIEEIRADFKDWMRQRIQNDTELAQRIEKEYNERFNAFVPKEIDKKFIPGHFAGQITKLKGKDFHLYDYQAKAAVLATMQPTLFAHEVGAGKTYTLITTAMEMRRLGTAHKPMIVVQNATVGQFVESAKELYPSAKVLALEDADRTKEGRKNFYAKIRYNDWDMIVIPQSVFERIPDSPQREARFKQEKIEETMHVLEQMREARGSSSKKSLQESRTEKELANLQAELNDILAGTLSKNPDGTFKDKTGKDKKREAKAKENAVARAAEMLDRETDDTLDFDDMGIDALLIDEAHEYKHLGFRTATQRGVKGVDSSYSKKSQGVYLKTQAVLENTGGKNVVFATGTPISNTAAEVWTFMRYLVPADTMKAYDIYYFDDFVRNFGLIEQRLEFNASGSYKEVSRFSGYVNLPELVRIWTSIADTVRTDEVEDLKEKIPEMEEGKPQDVFLPQTPTLRGVMKTVREMLADYERMSGKEKKENSHIPLTAYGIAKAAAVDARLVVDDAPDEPNSKTNETVRQTLRSLEETKDYNGTIAIFSDNYQNKASGFNLYEDIKKKLIAAGVPESQIVIMKPGMGIKSKLEIFDKVNSGEVRVIMGSTFTLGTGVNIQERLHTLIHVDAPVRPMDYTQRNGRILRQGNMHKEWGKPVRVLRFGVEDSLDVTAYDRLKTKQKIADSVMSGRKLLDNAFENRVLEEEDDIFGDITAQLSGSQYALLKNQMEKEVRKLTTRKEQWQAQQTYIHNQRPKLQGLIKAAEERKATAEEALKKVEAVTDRTITVAGQRFSGVEEMGDYIKEFNKKQRETQEQVRKSYDYNARQTRNLTVNVGGIDFIIKSEISKEQRREKGQLSIAFYASTKMTYDCPTLGLEDVPVKGQQIRAALDDITENVMSGDDMRERIEAAEASKERNAKELETLSKNDGKPFADAEKLETAKAKLEEYTEKMKEELAEKETKYAKMDSEVEAVKVHEAAEVEDEDTATGEGERAQKSVGDTMQPTEEQREQGAAIVDIVKEAGLPVSMDVEEMRNALLEGDAQYHAQISSLGKAAKTIKEWLAGGSRGKTFTIELPESTQRKVRQVMGRDFDSHNITANGVAHAKRNHGEQGTKLTDESIPLRDEDFELIPYIMTAPDRVEKGSTDASGRESVRFYKTLSNGYVVVVEKEYKNSPNDMETITMWAEKSSAATNARSEKNAPDTLVRNAIRSTDAAKVRKDAETAIANDRYLQKMTVFHGSAHSFDRFDHSHMGEGEGAQVHGWGTYVAVDKKTSRGYAESLSPREVTYKGTYGLKEIQDFGIAGKEQYELYAIEGIIGYMERHPSWSFDDAQDLFISQTEKSSLYSPSLKEKIIEAARKLQKEDFKTQATRNLYGVEIPDNNGRNYLEEEKHYSSDDVQELTSRLLEAAENDAEASMANALAERTVGLLGRDIYSELVDANIKEQEELGEGISISNAQKAASELLNKAGFVGIHYFGGQDGECYVIFNENDLKITSHEQFLRTPSGEVYGFVKDGKMYIDPRLLNPNTPIHEYTHLWDTALRKVNPKLWARGKELMKQLPLWEEVKNDPAYKDIAEDEDLLASEVHSRLSGAEGERLLAKMTEEAKKKGAIEYAEKLTLAQRIKQWMKDVLKFVRDAFAHKWGRGELESVTVEEFARMPIKDLMRGFNPTEVAKDESGTAQKRFIGEKGAANIDKAQKAHTMLDNLGVAREMEQAYKDLEGNPEEHKRMQEAAKAARELKAEKSENYPTTRDKAKEDYKAIGKATNKHTGAEVEFFVSAFKKNHREGGLFEKAIPALKKAFENAVLAYSEKEMLAGKTRPDGSVHKEHRSIETYDNYVGKVNIDGKDYYVRYTVQMQQGQNGVHSQMVTNVELYNTENPTNVASYRALSATARLGVNGIIPDAKLQRFFALASGNAHDFAKAVKFATGWERGADGKWRYEQRDFEFRPDGDANVRRRLDAQPWKQELDALSDKLIDGETPLTEAEQKRFDELSAKSDEIKAQEEQRDGKFLDDYIQDERLFTAYPQLKQVRVKVYSSLIGKRHGSFNRNGNNGLGTIEVEGKADDVKSTLAHEVQHAIQWIEGFARGGSPRMASAHLEAVRISHEVMAKTEETNPQTGKNYTVEEAFGEIYDKACNPKGGNLFNIGTSENTVRAISAIEESGDIAQTIRDLSSEKEMDMNGYDAYQHISGEVEARNVQSRMDMTDEERRQSLASETEDVARDEQIFLSNALGGSSAMESEVEAVKVHEAAEVEDEDTAMADGETKRYRTSGELNEEYPTWLSGQTTKTGQHTTQITSTVNTYKKIGQHLLDEGRRPSEVSILDASSGLGVGTQALREQGFDVEDVEPYPSEKREAPTYKTYEEIGRKYDVVISNAVLNVIPDDWRADVLKSMADKLKVGGRLFINVRDAAGIKAQKQKIELDSPSEILVTDKQGNIRAYQKGFTRQELADYVKGQLGEGYEVETATAKNSGMGGATAVVVTRKSDAPLRYRDLSEYSQQAYSEEEQAIIDRAKARGTYMKAPNGEPTKLTERQWAQVRTKAFKDWFGDWEKAAKGKLVESVSPTSLDEEKPMSQKEAEAAVEKLPLGKNKRDGRKVTWVKSSIGKILRHKGFDASLLVPKLKEVYDNSVHILSEEEVRKEGHKEHSNFKGYHHYVGKVSLRGKEYYVRFTIQEVNTHKQDFVPNQLHSTFVSDVEIYSADTRVNTGNTPATANISTNTDAKLAKFFEEARKAAENSSKAVDKNGEPKVFYHNTDSEFTVFDEALNGSHTDAGWLGDGFYFYGDENEGSGYGKNKMAVFLNVRDPYYATSEENNELAEANDRDKSREFREMVEDDGCDGVYYNGDLRQEAVVFSPNQIKSATDNSGAFSLGNDDIRYRSVQQGTAEAEQPLRTVAEGAARSLGLSERVEVITDTSELQNPKDRKAKGWYDTKTGRIAIVLPNHTSAEDVRRTILHEGVAHYGLRQLFGDHFDEFLRKVYEGVDAPTREQISRAALRGGFDFGTSTEEYLASLAETTNFEKAGSTWQKIKHLFKEMLRGLGFDIKISDGELRYILWRSYENLKEPDHYRNVFAQAEDIATQHRLKVGKYAVRSEEKSDDAGKRYRSTIESPNGGVARDYYERKTRKTDKADSGKDKAESLLWRLNKAYGDSMAALKAFTDGVLMETGNEMHSFEDAYKAENALSSATKTQQEAWERDFFNPIKELVFRLQNGGKSTYEDLKMYVVAKHGLERNEVLAQRDFDAYAQKHPYGTKKLADFRKRDYSGLTALTGKDITIEPWADYLEPTNEGDPRIKRRGRRARKAVEDMAAKLNLTGRVEVITDTSKLTEKGKTAKGWYDRKTNKITGLSCAESQLMFIGHTAHIEQGVAHTTEGGVYTHACNFGYFLKTKVLVIAHKDYLTLISGQAFH